MIITDEPFIVQEAEHNSIKVEFLPVGGSFLCKQYKGFRPSLIIDQTSDVSYERFSSHKVNAWVDAFIDSFDRRGVKVGIYR